MSQIIPIPHLPVSVRPATIDDLPFIDALQKLQTKQVGWMPTKQLEGKIAAGQVLLAESAEDCGLRTECDGSAVTQSSVHSTQSLGYVIGHDQYFKRDDCGIIYQVNVAAGERRGLIGATLVKAMFDRAAYGCRLFCCWCAQDIEANYFWESLGFIPLAFRAGSRGKDRVHIFWQRRIRAGDCATPYWFPSQTTAGAIREDRLVFPIPPGVDWRDAMPRVLPGDESSKRQLQAATSKRIEKPKARIANPPPPPVSMLGRLSFAPPPGPPARKKEKPQPKPKVKNDPKLVAAARELRDRWLEQVNSGSMAIEGPGAHGGRGKYDVARALPPASGASRMLPLPHAA